MIEDSEVVVEMNKFRFIMLLKYHNHHVDYIHQQWVQDHIKHEFVYLFVRRLVLSVSGAGRQESVSISVPRVRLDVLHSEPSAAAQTPSPSSRDRHSTATTVPRHRR